VEIKTEADSDDMTECLRYDDPHDDRPTTGMFDCSLFLLLSAFVCCLTRHLLYTFSHNHQCL